jgi:tripartite-type tricarboxylate transporter receptor subunit TctC
MFAPISTALPFIRSGTLKALAVTSPERSSSLPNVPTLAELGFTTSGAAIWFGLVAPRGTPLDRLTRLRVALGAALDDQAVKSQLELQGMIPLKGDADEFSARLDSEIARVRELDASDALAHQ